MSLSGWTSRRIRRKVSIAAHVAVSPILDHVIGQGCRNPHTVVSLTEGGMWRFTVLHLVTVSQSRYGGWVGPKRVCGKHEAHEGQASSQSRYGCSAPTRQG